MIERLNFYDLYGYLLPGLTLVTLLWLPYRIVNADVALPTALSSVLLTASLAYIVGHVLQALARIALPARKNGRSPNDFLLDNTDTTLSKALKQQLIDKIRTRFHIEVGDESSSSERTLRRSDAFLLCRAALLQNKAGLYAEQSEGMYALMRGVAAASLLGAAYNLGWSISWFLSERSKDRILGLLLIGWAAAAVLFFLAYRIVLWLRPRYQDKEDKNLSKTEQRRKRLLNKAFYFRAKLRFCGIVVLLVPVGCWLGLDKVTSDDSSLRLLAFTLVALLVCVICMEAYSYFAKGFAATVYRDFASLQEKATDPE